MKTSEINPARSEDFRFFKQFSRESILITLTAICCIITADNYFRTSRAIDAANLANATAGTWQTMYKETERECRLAQMEIDDFKMMLAKAGISTEHIGEKP